MLSTILGGNLSFFGLITMLLSYALVIFVTLPLHEWAHALIATKLGDPTPRWHGRLSLNPLHHLDLFGTLMLLLFGFGYAKPVPVNPRHFRNRRGGMALVALAGPVSNLLLATVSVGICRLLIEIPTTNETALTVLQFVVNVLLMMATVNISLAVFNLLPIPPLDGYRVASLVLPSRWTFWLDTNQQLVTFGLMLLLAVGKLDVPLSYAQDAVWTVLLKLFRF